VTAQKPELATATVVVGMFCYFGGALFTLLVGALANAIGCEPPVAMLFAFDSSALRQRRGRGKVVLNQLRIQIRYVQ
jgi:hypothetical protein